MPPSCALVYTEYYLPDPDLVAPSLLVAYSLLPYLLDHTLFTCWVAPSILDRSCLKSFLLGRSFLVCSIAPSCPSVAPSSTLFTRSRFPCLLGSLLPCLLDRSFLVYQLGRSLFPSSDPLLERPFLFIPMYIAPSSHHRIFIVYTLLLDRCYFISQGQYLLC